MIGEIDVELSRRLVKNALAFGRAHQSPFTSFIHYAFESPASRETIPLFENFCFALALMRSHIAAQVLEGKDLLEKLLAFQTKEGAFPVYLHAYPSIEKPLANVAFLLPLFHIWDGYRHVLGKESVGKLENGVESLYAYVDTLSLPPILLFQKKAFAYAYYQSEKPEIPNGMITSKEYSDVLLGVELLGERLEIPWHPVLKVFTGALANELTYGYSPRKTAIDLLWHEEEKAPISLLGALLFQPQVDLVTQDKSSYLDTTWYTEGEGTFLCTRVDHFMKTALKTPPGLQQFRILFGPHTLAFANPAFEVRTERRSDSHYVIQFLYPDEPPEEKQERGELALYVNHTPPLDIRISNQKATWFQLNEKVTLENKEGKLSLVFSLLEGEGRFSGHLMRSNRPGQTLKEEYTAHDYTLLLRTLERQGPIKIELSITWQKKSL